MSKHTGRNAAIVILLLVAVAYYGNTQGWFNNLGTTTTQASVINTNVNPVNTQTIAQSGTGSLGANDQLTVTVVNHDGVSGAAITEGSGVDMVTYNKLASGGYTQIGGGASSSLTLRQADNGQVSVGFVAHAAGQHYILSPEKTANANSGTFASCVYTDPLGTGVKKYVCQFNTTNMKTQAQLSGVAPTLAINAMYDYAGTGSLSSPADQTSLGTTANKIITIEWQNTGTAGQNLYVTHVQLKVNSTSISKWNAGDSYITLAGQQYPLTTATQVTNTGSTTLYDWTFGYTPDKVKIVTFPSNSNPKDYESAHLSLNLATSDVLAWTWSVDTEKELDAQQSTLSDLVNTAA